VPSSRAQRTSLPGHGKGAEHPPWTPRKINGHSVLLPPTMNADQGQEGGLMYSSVSTDAYPTAWRTIPLPPPWGIPRLHQAAPDTLCSRVTSIAPHCDPTSYLTLCMHALYLSVDLRRGISCVMRAQCMLPCRFLPSAPASPAGIFFCGLRPTYHRHGCHRIQKAFPQGCRPQEDQCSRAISASVHISHMSGDHTLLPLGT